MKKKRGRSKITEWLLLNLLPWPISLAIRFTAWSSQLDVVGLEILHGFQERDEGVIISWWHDQLLLVPVIPSRRVAKVLISASRDGELIARVLACFGHEAVRGSSHRRGREAFRELVTLTRNPGDLGFTPDGPRGPRHQLKPGVAQLSRLSGWPVLPLAFACSRGRRFNSWDRFLLPYPGGRGVFVFAEPVYPRKGEKVEELQARLAAAMAAAHRRARWCLEKDGLPVV